MPREERLRTSDGYYSLLFMVEIAYHASGEPAPFDADPPRWLAPNARTFVSSLGADLGPAVWSALIGARPMSDDVRAIDPQP